MPILYHIGIYFANKKIFFSYFFWDYDSGRHLARQRQSCATETIKAR